MLTGTVQCSVRVLPGYQWEGVVREGLGCLSDGGCGRGSMAVVNRGCCLVGFDCL